MPLLLLLLLPVLLPVPLPLPPPPLLLGDHTALYAQFPDGSMSRFLLEHEKACDPSSCLSSHRKLCIAPRSIPPQDHVVLSFASSCCSSPLLSATKPRPLIVLKHRRLSTTKLRRVAALLVSLSDIPLLFAGR